jgi:hypothetical protein
MRALRERPRMVAAQLLVGLVLVGGGLLIGRGLSDDSGDVPRDRLDRVERQAARSASEVTALRRRIDATEAAATRAGVRADRARRTNGRLRRELARALRALRRARQGG